MAKTATINMRVNSQIKADAEAAITEARDIMSGRDQGESFDSAAARPPSPRLS